MTKLEINVDYNKAKFAHHIMAPSLVLERIYRFARQTMPSYFVKFGAWE